MHVYINPYYSQIYRTIVHMSGCIGVLKGYAVVPCGNVATRSIPGRRSSGIAGLDLYVLCTCCYIFLDRKEKKANNVRTDCFSIKNLPDVACDGFNTNDAVIKSAEAKINSRPGYESFK